MKNENQNIVLKIGVAVGAYFFVVSPILTALGVRRTIEQQKNIEDATGTGGTKNPFNPDYWKANPTGVISQNAASIYAQSIYDSFGLFGDDEELVISIFRKLQRKADVSRVADMFNQKFGGDMLAFMRVGSPFSGLWGGLSDSDLNRVLKIVNSLK